MGGFVIILFNIKYSSSINIYFKGFSIFFGAYTKPIPLLLMQQLRSSFLWFSFLLSLSKKNMPVLPVKKKPTQQRNNNHEDSHSNYFFESQ
mmetsp:Transcript_10766/g.13466  ORF Transcript_10766/g.13466 Transcript_10766/m.13466 type:complete len:91 (+) Transcript_10766:185-457(+)